MSGRLQGAGGIGGLLARTDANGTAFYHADGNGNITALVNGSQAVVAKYCYDPYGNLVSQSGSLADANLYRFSSKELHPNAGTYYYGFRSYDPALQRWLNQDPAQESGGINLHLFVHNSPTRHIDGDGLAPQLTMVSAPVNRYGVPTGPPTGYYSGDINYGSDIRAAHMQPSLGLDQVQGWLDAVGVFDPTILSDGLNSLIYAADGNWEDAGISALGMIPYLLSFA